MTHKEIKRYCEALAGLYGVNLTWLKGDWAFYFSGTNRIAVGTKMNKREIISAFCHELGHYINFLDEKYYNYHSNYKGKYFGFKTVNRAARYALKAEIYTDKVGKLLCEQWFPGVKYQRWYYNNEKNLKKIKEYHFNVK